MRMIHTAIRVVVFVSVGTIGLALRGWGKNQSC